MSVEEKYAKLVDLLFDRTMDRSLNWEWIPSVGTLNCEIGSNTIKMTASSNENFEDLYQISILNRAGVYVEGFTDETISSVAVKYPDYASQFNYMEALFEHARRQAVGADVALNDILKRLESGDIDEVPF